MSTLDDMLNNPKAPTADLDEFIAAYEADSNLWWRTESGHHQNLFDAAVDRAELLQIEVDRLTAELAKYKPAAVPSEGPHSRACGIRRHDHGPDCHSNCPTCGGRRG